MPGPGLSEAPQHPPEARGTVGSRPQVQEHVEGPGGEQGGHPRPSLPVALEQLPCSTACQSQLVSRPVEQRLAVHPSQRGSCRRRNLMPRCHRLSRLAPGTSWLSACLEMTQFPLPARRF